MKLGYEREKQRTSLLNRMLQSVIEAKEAKMTQTNTKRKLEEAYSNPFGSLVAALRKIPLKPDGSIVDGWEKRVLC